MLGLFVRSYSSLDMISPIQCCVSADPSMNYAEEMEELKN